MQPYRLLLVLGICLVSPVLRAQPGTPKPALVGYYAGNGHDLDGRPIDQLTHLIWCFGHLQGDSMVVAPTQEKVIRKMVGLKRQNPQLKVLLSLGGWADVQRVPRSSAMRPGGNTSRKVRASS